MATWSAVAWAGVIFGMSSLPGSAIPGRFGSLAHFVEYAVLGALVFAAASDSGDRVGGVILATALASAWGITDELHQSFVVLRVADPVDWLVDTAGATTGALLLATAGYALARRRAAG